MPAILGLLARCVGVPFLALAATGPLLQDWSRRVDPTRVPYRLYALSNAGSLLALLAYPFVVESRFTRLEQATLWAWGFGLFLIGSAVCAAKLWRLPPTASVSRVGAVAATTEGGDRGGVSREAALAPPPRVRVGSPPRHHQQVLPGRSGDAAALGVPPRDLSRELHSDVRQPAMVRAALVRKPPRGDARRRVLGSVQEQRPGAALADGRLRRPPARGLHGLPRRASTACGRTRDASPASI